MCGRFVISKFPDDVARWFGTTGPVPNSQPRYNVAPTDQIAVVRFNPETQERSLTRCGGLGAVLGEGCEDRRYDDQREGRDRRREAGLQRGIQIASLSDPRRWASGARADD